ncbi:MAG: zinc ABC transporter ATP-binding protein, partial [bacterium]
YDLVSGLRTTRKCGILMVSHDLHLVMSATDRVFCLNRHICCAGRPEVVMKDEAYVSLFGARAAAGLAVYSHRHDHVH